MLLCKSLHKLTFSQMSLASTIPHSDDKLLWKLMYKLCFRIIKVCISFCITVFINLGSKQTIVYTGIHHPRTDSWASWNWERMRLSVSEILGSLSNITYPLQEDPLSVLCISIRHQTKCKKQKGWTQPYFLGTQWQRKHKERADNHIGCSE